MRIRTSHIVMMSTVIVLALLLSLTSRKRDVLSKAEKTIDEIIQTKEQKQAFATMQLLKDEIATMQKELPLRPEPSPVSALEALAPPWKWEYAAIDRELKDRYLLLEWGDKKVTIDEKKMDLAEMQLRYGNRIDPVRNEITADSIKRARESNKRAREEFEAIEYRQFVDLTPEK